ncbi:DUF1294 domain-containing protein [Thalassotalea nanhaiensis]|uniref:DUF1294 domain-containing protein n=1 Tax=Thalassotalea nanhaiensis TaxID=3065648 RepID=A0ABY9TN01_9GAMM|nr:DUF1294 domain-containing protein [Colwelliaceae bacterium SQ345]
MAHHTVKQGKNRRVRNSNNASIYFALLFIMSVGLLVVFNELAIHFLAGYVVLSIITMIMYGWDKKAAEKGHWRTPELTLQLLALIGGWPGAVWAQQKFRHKSRKLSFRIQLWLMIIFNVSAFVWFCVPLANSFIQSWF